MVPLYERTVVPALEAFRPDVLLVSAGFDAHERDPLAGCRMSTAGLARLTELLVAPPTGCVAGASCWSPRAATT